MAAVDWFAQAEVAEPVLAPRRRRAAAELAANPRAASARLRAAVKSGG